MADRPPSTVHRPPATVSLIVVSHNEGDNLRATVHSLLASLPPGGGEIVVVDDQSTDGSADRLHGYHNVRVLRHDRRLGVAAARNYGGIQSQGDVLVFCDAHIEAPWDWADHILPLLDNKEVGAVAPAISIMHKREVKGYGLRWVDAALNVRWLPRRGRDPYPVPLLPGCFLAMRRDVFERTGGPDAGLAVWGMVDGELSIRLWTLGYTCLLVPTLEVAHLFRQKHGYSVHWESLLYNALRLAVIHFGEARTRDLVACLTSNPALPGAVARLASSDAWARRQEVCATRRYDDDWYFARFQ